MAARRSTSIWYSMLIAAALTSGCRDSLVLPENSSAPSRSEIRSVNVPTGKVHEQVARAFALAMADGAVRAGVLRSMRRSEFNEHKLVLQDFVVTEEGAALVAAAAAAIRNTSAAPATGSTSASVGDLVERLPGPMDFYVPLPEQRRSWRGSSDVVVAAILDPDATEAVGFDTQGRRNVLFSPADAGASAFFIIHPAEYKSAQARLSTEGETIEELQASTATGGVMLAATCGPNALEGCTGGGGTGCVGATPFGTYVCQITVLFGDGLFAGNPEIYFNTNEVGNPSNFMRSATVNVIKDQKVLIDLQIFPSQASSFQVLVAELWEQDGGFNGGDDFNGESVPFISGAGNYTSIDAFRVFLQQQRADYNVILRP